MYPIIIVVLKCACPFPCSCHLKRRYDYIIIYNIYHLRQKETNNLMSISCLPVALIMILKITMNPDI